MKIYWSLSLHSAPELADLPYRDRRRLLWECWGKVMWRWPVLLVSFVLFPAMLVGGMFLVGYLALAVGLGWPLALLLVSSVVGPAYGFILTQVSLPLVRPYLRAARFAESPSGQQADPGTVEDRGH
jgi:hypothetical protein